MSHLIRTTINPEQVIEVGDVELAILTGHGIVAEAIETEPVETESKDAEPPADVEPEPTNPATRKGR